MCHYDYDDETGYRDIIECGECHDLNNRLFSLETSLRQVISHLYGHQQLDVMLLDHAISDMCDTVGFVMPPNMPSISRNESETFEFAVSV